MASTINVKLTRLQLRMVKEWLTTGRQADIDAFSEEGLDVYGISQDRCEKEWKQILEQLKWKSKSSK